MDNYSPEDQMRIAQAMQNLGYMNSAQPQANDDYKWDVLATDIIEELEHDLKGEVFIRSDDPDTPEIEGKWEKRTGQQLLNEKGIREIITIVRSLVNKVMFFSNLDEYDIRLLTMRMRQNIAQNLFLNWEEYDIKKSDLTIVTDKVVYFMYVALKRALFGEERKSKREGRSTNVHVIEGFGQKQQQQGWFPKIFNK